MIEVLQLKSGMSVNKMVKGSEESKGWSGEDLRGRRGGASVQAKEIMEKAKLKMLKKVVESEMEKEDEEEAKLKSSRPPAFPHIGPSVRKKQERKKLMGYTCAECDDYQALKFEGWSKHEIECELNKNSRHRAQFKPSLTPPRFKL